MNQDQLRARALALFHSLVSTWSNDLRGDVTGFQDQINRHLDALQERMAKYEESIDERKILAFADEVAKAAAPAAGGGALARVRGAMSRLEHGGTVSEVLTNLVQELTPFAPRVALFVVKGTGCVGWHGQGFDQSPGFSNDALKRVSVPTNADTVFRAVIQSRQSFFGESTAHRDNVQLLSRMGSVLPSNLFAMPLVLRDRVAAVIYADSGDSREPLSGTEAIEILVLYSGKLLDSQSGTKPGRTTAEIQPVRVETAKEAAPPPKARAATVAERDEAGTVMLHTTDLQPPAPARGPSTAPSVAPAPMDVDARKHHEDAKRFARLLVSEIKLYNEAKVQTGRRNRDLYQQLRDDIERSRQLYFERIPASVRATSDYFNEELVRILAEGDPGALGHPQ